eukprot:2319961-Heterocapsa_arctica.AAC.1
MASNGLRGAAAHQAARPSVRVLPMMMSRHAFRSSRRHQARLRQDQRILELEALTARLEDELRQWRGW